MRIALTGATSLLGRNLLFEFIKRYRRHLDQLEVIVLGRHAGGLSLKQRIAALFADDGAWYICGKPMLDQDVLEFVENRIWSLDFDLLNGSLEHPHYQILARRPLDYFFHIAALLDFRDSRTIQEALIQANVIGTQRVLSLVSSLIVREFVYVGSAYECGVAPVGGTIEANTLDLDRPFRNPYERTKAQAELLVRDFERSRKVRCRYFKPSTLCGRLLEPPLGQIPKFDVFYAWAGFFLRYKLKFLRSPEERLTTPVELKMRICYRSDSGLNIVPADYAAKVMYVVCASDAPGSHFHLVNDGETPHALYVPMMAEAVNVTGHVRVDRVPEDQNPHELVYYRTAGRILMPYVTCDPMLFDVSNLEGILRPESLRCPPVDANNFAILMNYARRCDFGVSF